MSIEVEANAQEQVQEQVQDIESDLFTCEVFSSYRNDMASMIHPIFSLSTVPDHRKLRYVSADGKNTIEITPGADGLATIYDKDLLLYIFSCLIHAKNKKQPISKTIKFVASDFFKATGRKADGPTYSWLKSCLLRLQQTIVTTNIITGNKLIVESFALIGTVRREEKIKKYGDKSKNVQVSIEIELKDWFYNSVLSKEVLLINKDYFNIRKPTDRRLYEIAKKTCGNKDETFPMDLSELKERIGTNSPLNKFRFNLKAAAKARSLPEFDIILSDDNDKVVFRQVTEVDGKRYTNKDLRKLARPGEELKDIKTSLSGKEDRAVKKQNKATHSSI